MNDGASCCDDCDAGCAGETDRSFDQRFHTDLAGSGLGAAVSLASAGSPKDASRTSSGACFVEAPGLPGQRSCAARLMSSGLFDGVQPWARSAGVSSAGASRSFGLRVDARLPQGVRPIAGGAVRTPPPSLSRLAGGVAGRSATTTKTARSASNPSGWASWGAAGGAVGAPAPHVARSGTLPGSVYERFLAPQSWGDKQAFTKRVSTAKWQALGKLSATVDKPGGGPRTLLAPQLNTHWVDVRSVRTPALGANHAGSPGTTRISSGWPALATATQGSAAFRAAHGFHQSGTLWKAQLPMLATSGTAPVAGSEWVSRLRNPATGGSGPGPSVWHKTAPATVSEWASRLRSAAAGGSGPGPSVWDKLTSTLLGATSESPSGLSQYQQVNSPYKGAGTGSLNDLANRLRFELPLRSGGVAEYVPPSKGTVYSALSSGTSGNGLLQPQWANSGFSDYAQTLVQHSEVAPGKYRQLVTSTTSYQAEPMGTASRGDAVINGQGLTSILGGSDVPRGLGALGGMGKDISGQAAIGLYQDAVVLKDFPDNSLLQFIVDTARLYPEAAPADIWLTAWSRRVRVDSVDNVVPPRRSFLLSLIEAARNMPSASRYEILTSVSRAYYGPSVIHGTFKNPLSTPDYELEIGIRNLIVQGARGSDSSMEDVILKAWWLRNSFGNPSKVVPERELVGLLVKTARADVSDTAAGALNRARGALLYRRLGGVEDELVAVDGLVERALLDVIAGLARLNAEILPTLSNLVTAIRDDFWPFALGHRAARWDLPWPPVAQLDLAQLISLVQCAAMDPEGLVDTPTVLAVATVPLMRTTPEQLERIRVLQAGPPDGPAEDDGGERAAKYAAVVQVFVFFVCAAYDAASDEYDTNEFGRECEAGLYGRTTRWAEEKMAEFAFWLVHTFGSKSVKEPEKEPTPKDDPLPVPPDPPTMELEPGPDTTPEPPKSPLLGAAGKGAGKGGGGNAISTPSKDAPTTIPKPKPPTPTSPYPPASGFTLNGTSGVTYQFLCYLVKLAGGSRTWRNNNPGALAGGCGDFHMLGTDRPAGAAVPGLAIFPDVETGWNALKCLVNQNAQKTITELMWLWAPPKAPNDPTGVNDPAGYARRINKLTGLDVKSRKILTLQDDEREQLYLAIMTVEGDPGGTVETLGYWREGTTTKTDQPC